MAKAIQPFPHTNTMLELELNHTSECRGLIIYKNKFINNYSQFQVF